MSNTNIKLGQAKLSNGQEMLLRKLVFALPLIGSIAIGVLLVLGFVPFYAKPFSISEALRVALNLCYFQRWSIVNSTVALVYIITYAVILILTIRAIKDIAQQRDVLFAKYSRLADVNRAIGKATERFNKLLIDFMGFYSFSYFIMKFTIGKQELIAFAVMIALYLSANFSGVLCRKRSGSEAFVSTLGGLVLVAAEFFFVVFVSRVYVNGFLDTLLSGKKMLGLYPNPQLILQLALSTVILPLLFLFAAGNIREMAKESYGATTYLSKRGRWFFVLMIIYAVVRSGGYAWISDGDIVKDFVQQMITSLPLILFAYVVYRATVLARYTLFDYGMKPVKKQKSTEAKKSSKKKINQLEDNEYEYVYKDQNDDDYEYEAEESGNEQSNYAFNSYEQEDSLSGSTNTQPLNANVQENVNKGEELDEEMDLFLKDF